MEETYFVRAMGSSPTVRVLDFLLQNKFSDYTKAEIANEISIAPMTLDKVWDRLVELGMVKETRRIGNGRLYKLDEDSPIVEQLKQLDQVRTLAGSEVDIQTEMEGMRASA
jgi:DNA-binding transcriptional ArsR family regulator